MPYLAILANKADLTHMRTVHPAQHTEFADLHKMHRWAKVVWCNWILIPLLTWQYAWCSFVQLFCFSQDRRQCGYSILPHCGRHSWCRSHFTWHQQRSEGDYSLSHQSSSRRAQQQHEQKTHQKPDKMLYHVAIATTVTESRLDESRQSMYKHTTSSSTLTTSTKHCCSAFGNLCLQLMDRMWAIFPAPWLVYSAHNQAWLVMTPYCHMHMYTSLCLWYRCLWKNHSWIILFDVLSLLWRLPLPA